MASVIALDFGNENLVTAIPRNGGVDIALNQSGARLTPTMVGFDDTRRYAGEFAKTQQMQNPKFTITQLKRLIGLKYDSPEREVVQKLICYQIVKLDNGMCGVQVEYRGQQTVLCVEQCLALMLHDIFTIAQSYGAHTHDIVIAISPWWDESRRRVLLDAAKICGYNVLKLLNSTTGAAITYSMYHRSRLPTEAAKSVPVAFIDFGDSTLNVAIAQLHQGSVEIKGFCCDEHIGGSDFTNALMEYLLEETKKKYKIDPTGNARAMLRFRAAAEKVKKALSINPVVPFEVQCLMNDIDVHFLVKREEFEKRIAPLVDRLEAPILRALELAHVKKEDLYAIEFHGGASRVAKVKAWVKEIFGKEPTQSLNPDECFALGAGFQAAILSPQYRVDLNLKDVAPHRIMIEYKDDEKGETKTAELFKQFNVVPCTKTVPIKIKQQSHVRLYTDDGDLGYVDITTSTDDILATRLQIRLTPDGLVDVQKCFYVEQHEIEVKEEVKPEPKPKEEKKEEKPAEEKKEEKKEEEVKKEEKKEEEKKEEEAKKEEKKEEEKPAEQKKEEEAKKEEEKKYITKKQIVKTDVPVAFIYKPVYGLSKDKIEEYQKVEQQMEKTDEQEHAIDHIRNDLESYIYTLESAFDRDYPEYFDPAKKDEQRKKVDEVHMWFSETEFDRLTYNEYNDKLKVLKEFGDPAHKRREQRMKIPEIVNEFKARGEAARTRLDQKDEKFAHIGEELRAPVRKEIDDYVAWLEEQAKKAEETPKHKDISLKRFECESKANIIEGKVQSVLCTPKPKPKKEEKKEEKKEKKEGEEETKKEKKEGEDEKAEKPEEKKEGGEQKAEEKKEETKVEQPEEKKEVKAPNVDELD